MSAGDVLLQMRGIAKRYPGVVALDGVDLEVRTGEVHVLLGENGAGKSTLMKILAGAVQRDAGALSIGGEVCAMNSPRDAQRAGVSIIYQEFNLIPHLSVAENIFLGREPRMAAGILIDGARMEREAQRLLTDLQVRISPRAIVADLGVAEQQMVEVAKALSVEARILVMDEPTSALTDKEILQLFSVIRRLRDRGVAVIYISHRMEELFRIGDRVTVLRDGRHIATRDLRDTTMNELVRLMVGRDLTDHFPKVAVAPGVELLRVERLRREGVLHDISFSLHRGEVLGIAGLMGSGRTELARAIFGADAIDGGEVFVHGRPVRFRSPREAIAAGIGFLTEDRKRQGLVLCLDVKENVCLASVDRFSTVGIVSCSREDAAAGELSATLRVKTPTIRQRVLNLSGGNQQKVVLAKWLCREADILIFDEPTRGIDVGSKVEIYQLINRLAAAGKAVLMISSELPEVLGMCDRVLVMNRGRTAGMFKAAEASPEKILHCALAEVA